jgi:iron complex outermembrane recepter protein
MSFRLLPPRRVSSLFAAVFTMLLALPSHAGEMETMILFDIEAQPLSTALIKFSKQAHIQVMSAGADLETLAAPAVRGRLTPSQVLDLLLAGTQLRHNFVGNHTIAIGPKAAHSSSANQMAGSVRLMAASDRSEASTPDDIQSGSLDGPSGPPADNPSKEQLAEIVVTGSYLHRTNTETPSPVQIIGAEEIERSGKTSISDVIRSLSADNSGSLSQAFDQAGAAGGSGVSLRGLTVNATLVLVDGHRMTPYPLEDDGQRSFVDLSSLPLAIIDRVEVLKDGASSAYGSDAIAGVVNIILKKSFTGLALSADGGITTRGDGATERAALTWGMGDLDKDDRNFYVSVEYRHQSRIAETSRGSYLSNLDLRPYGGPDNTGGIIQPGNVAPSNFTQTTVGMVAPLVNGAQAGPFQLLPGCTTPNYSGGCTWNKAAEALIQPDTHGVDATARFTQRFADGWEGRLTASVFESASEQVWNTGPAQVPTVWAGSGNGLVVDQTNPATTPIVLPIGHPDNPFPNAQALLYYTFADVGAEHRTVDTTISHLVGDLHGSIGSWELSTMFGYGHGQTDSRYYGWIRASVLDQLLASDTYRVGVNAHLNSPALYAALSPMLPANATSSLAFASVTGTHNLAELSGGPLGLAVGAEGRHLTADNPAPPYTTSGDIVGFGSGYSYGTETVKAGYAELVAPFAKWLEVDASGRYDYYTSDLNAFTPKFGVKWTPLSMLALRGTFSRGFRAPGIAERGTARGAGSTLGPVDPIRCPVTHLASDCNGALIGLESTSNPNLKPERSRSYTLGIVFEPAKTVNLSLDYFNIRRDGDIVFSTAAGGLPTRGAPQSAYPNLPGPYIFETAPYINALFTRTAGVDADLRTKFGLHEFGELTIGLTATYLTMFQQAVPVTFPDGSVQPLLASYVGTVGPTVISGEVGTPRTRGSIELAWQRGALTIGSFVNYHSGLKAIDQSIPSFVPDPTNPNKSIPTFPCLTPINPASCRIASFTTTDLFAHYDWSEHLAVNFELANVFDRIAPLNTVSYGGVNYNPSLDQAGAVGRYAQVGVRYKF